eukprot:Pgem_evm1s18858
MKTGTTSLSLLGVSIFTTLIVDSEGSNIDTNRTCYGYDECPTRGQYDVPFNSPWKYKTYYNSYHNGGSHTDKFPDNFLWGVGTAAFQIEGGYRQDGRGASIWDTHAGANTTNMPGSHCDEMPCPLNSGMRGKGATGNIANDHYNKMEEDVLMMKSLGVKTYRFSIAWPRIYPTGKKEDGANQLGIDFYNRLFDSLEKHGIEAVVTLYHWDLPQGLLDARYNETIPICDDAYGQGWYECELRNNDTTTPYAKPMNETKIIQHYVDYATLMFETFGNRAKAWTTFNEAWTFSSLGAGQGDAPSVQPYTDPNTWMYIAGHNVIRAHAAATKVFYDLQANGTIKKSVEIGMVNNCDWRDPETQSPQDVAAAMRTLESSLGWFADPVYGVDGKHDYPNSMKLLLGSKLPTFTQEEKDMLKKYKSNYFGLNHYGSAHVSDCPDYKCNGYTDEGPLEWKLQGAPDLVNGNGSNTVQIKANNVATAQANWLFAAGWGLRKLLNYVDARYGQPKIYVTENGFSEQADAAMQAKYDAGRLVYYNNYLKAIAEAINNDKVDVQGYFAWSLYDNFE